jgi:hypothetical protein
MYQVELQLMKGQTIGRKRLNAHKFTVDSCEGCTGS